MGKAIQPGQRSNKRQGGHILIGKGKVNGEKGVAIYVKDGDMVEQRLLLTNAEYRELVKYIKDNKIV